MFVKSKMDYATQAWQPWLSETGDKALDRVQNKALRLVTGQKPCAIKPGQSTTLHIQEEDASSQ